MFAKTILFAGLASAATFQVKVGQGGNVFEPSTVTAQVGDTVEFHFSGVRHDVVQSTFDSPCSPLSGGFVVPPQTSSSKVFTVTVSSTDPQYFYCSVSNHCNTGMVGIINPATGKTQSDFASAAKGATLDAPGNSVSGGTLTDGSPTTSGSVSSTASSGSSSSTPASGASGSSTSSSKAGGVATAIPAALAVVAGAVAALF